MRPHVDTDEEAGAARLGSLNRLAAISFVLGGSLFSLGAFFAQRDVGSTTTVNVTYLVGGVFFSLGGFVSILLANALDDPGRGPTWAGGIRHLGQRALGVRSAVVLFVGTCFFAVSLVAAFAEGLTPRQSNGWIWLPDIVGCVCFLASGHLALRDFAGGDPGGGDVGAWSLPAHAHQLGWWVVVLNQVGSYLFFLAGLAAFTRPATSAAVNTGLVNWGTFAGAVCFAVGGLVQALDTPTPTRTVVQHPS